MDRRLNLHQTLKRTFRAATRSDPEGRIFYQSPGSQKLKYPCLIYKLTDMPADWSGNLPYRIEHEYELTVIDPDPLSPLREAVARLPQCRLVRVFESDNLHHYVFHIYD